MKADGKTCGQCPVWDPKTMWCRVRAVIMLAAHRACSWGERFIGSGPSAGPSAS